MAFTTKPRQSTLSAWAVTLGAIAIVFVSWLAVDYHSNRPGNEPQITDATNQASSAPR